MGSPNNSGSNMALNITSAVITLLAIAGIIAAKTGHLTLESFMSMAGKALGCAIALTLMGVIAFWLMDVIASVIKAKAFVIPVAAVLVLLGILASGAGGASGFLVMTIVAIVVATLLWLLGGS
ncbi:MAG: hypothetical protein PVI21_03170 [Candidatus Woesebacteria bacterium]|jgi:hypothetical protein